MAGLDPRIARGTASMLELRRSALSSGASPLGWKVGFGSPSGLAALEIDRPLVGFLTRDRLLESGAGADVTTGWTRPVLEAEVAAYVALDLGPGAEAEEALAAIGGWSLAIELADVDQPPKDVEEILAGNIFHRHVLFGDVVPARPDPASLVVSVLRDGVEVAATGATEDLTGELGWVLATTADTLAACGASLTAGDVVITGAVVPPIPVSAGSSWKVSAASLGPVEVRLEAGRETGSG